MVVFDSFLVAHGEAEGRGTCENRSKHGVKVVVKIKLYVYLPFSLWPSKIVSFYNKKQYIFQAGIGNEISQRSKNGYKKATEVATDVRQ